MSTTIEHDGFTIESNHETAEAMQAALNIEAPHEAAATNGAGDGDVGSDSGVGETPASAVAEAPVAQSGAHDRKPKPKENVQARINQALEKQRKAEERASALESELQQVRARAVPPADAPSPKPAAAPVGEKFPSYDTWAATQESPEYEDYIDARTRHNYAAMRKVEQQERDTQERQTRRQQLETAHNERVDAAVARYPDYWQAVNAIDQQIAAARIPTSEALVEAILGSDSSADVVYWLATHPQDALQLAREVQGLPVSAASIVKRLLEARLGAGVSSGSVPSAELPKTRPPVRPVGVSSVVVPDEPGDDEPIERYIARHNAADRKRGRL